MPTCGCNSIEQRRDGKLMQHYKYLFREAFMPTCGCNSFNQGRDGNRKNIIKFCKGRRSCPRAAATVLNRGVMGKNASSNGGVCEDGVNRLERNV